MASSNTQAKQKPRARWLTRFNPLVVVFRPLRWAKTYRFLKPFKDYKRGKPAALETLESHLFEYLSRVGIGTCV